MKKEEMIKKKFHKRYPQKTDDHLKATLFVGIMYSDDALLDEVIGTLKKRFGPIKSRTDAYDFSGITSYYEKEMGRGIKKIIIVFEKIPIVDLPDIKLYTISLEKRYSIGKSRRINIDPGYFTITNVVLATTKNFTHRIYLGKGIYADLTMMFRKGQTVLFEWTYPDFRLKALRDFFYSQRQSILEIRNISKKERPNRRILKKIKKTGGMIE